MTGKQTQKAGDYSNLVQADTVILGIDEKRVREILEEQLPVALKDFTAEASAVANSRSKKFNGSLLIRMVQESALAAFSDPSFQILLIEAQKRAASTERDQDYDLLSELMVHRFQKGSNRIIRAGISRAVEIVDQISDDALLGITVFHTVSNFIPTSGDMALGLKTLDALFEKVIYNNLPTNNDWLDHLDILDAVRISSFGGTKLLEDYWYEQFDGYIKNGIEENSEKHIEAKEILTKAALDQTCLSKNVLNEKYVKIAVMNKKRISKLTMTDASGKRILTDDEKTALERLYEMYDDTKMSKEDFIKEIEKYPYLKKLRGWWNTLTEQTIQITSVGRVLAHSNAQRVDKSLPPLD
jgi:hypothetical protein